MKFYFVLFVCFLNYSIDSIRIKTLLSKHTWVQHQWLQNASAIFVLSKNITAIVVLEPDIFILLPLAAQKYQTDNFRERPKSKVNCKLNIKPHLKKQIQVLWMGPRPDFGHIQPTFRVLARRWWRLDANSLSFNIDKQIRNVRIKPNKQKISGGNLSVGSGNTNTHTQNVIFVCVCALQKCLSLQVTDGFHLWTWDCLLWWKSNGLVSSTVTQ